MTSMDRWIAIHQRRLTIGQLLEKAAEFLALFLFVFGSTVLAAKLLFPAIWPHVLWLALGAIPVAGAAGWLIQRERFTRLESVAMLDRKLNAGGLLMTLSEAPDDVWAQRLPQLESEWRDSLPRVRPVRFARYLSLPLLFAVGACFVPLREAKSEPVVPNLAGQQASQELADLLEVVEEAPVLEEEDKQELREEIELLIEETEQTPLTHEKWETLDALRERLKTQVDAASITASNAHNAVVALSDGTNLSPERMGQLEQDVLEALRKMSDAGAFKSAASSMKGQLQDLLKQGSLRLSKDPSAREQQLADLQEFLKSECDKLGQCRGKCQGGNSSSEGLGNTPGAKPGSKPGRGGINRGRGDAEMTWGDESDEAGTKFKEVALPPGFFDDSETETVGTSLTVPEVDPAATAPRGARRSNSSASGSDTWNRPLRPRHRNIVRKYFDAQ